MREKENGFRGYILPEDGWTFFNQNEARLRNEIVIVAENVDTGYTLGLTIERGTRLARVYRDGVVEKEDAIVSYGDCIDVLCFLIDRYLVPCCDYATPVGMEDADDKSADEEEERELFGDYPEEDEDEDEDEDIADKISDRENELLLAVEDFIQSALSDYNSHWLDLLQDEDLQDILDYFLSYLSDEYGLPILRPILIEDEDTKETHYTDYPYDYRRETGETVKAADANSGSHK